VDEEYVEAVLSAVEQIPLGRVSSYGDIAARVGRGGPRQVGQVMSHYGSAVPWWRVVRADGRPATGHEEEALRHLREEDVAVLGDRVDLGKARFHQDTNDW